MSIVAADVEYEALYSPEDGRIHFFANNGDRSDERAIPRCQQDSPSPVAVAVETSGNLPTRRGAYRTCRFCVHLNREDRKL
ncbi:hypothetical protein [Amycolatopsis japonica]